MTTCEPSQPTLFADGCDAPATTSATPPALWPTPVASTNRKSPRALHGTGPRKGRGAAAKHSSPPGLEQAVELASGRVPREYAGVGDLPVSAQRYLAGLMEGSSISSPGDIRASHSPSPGSVAARTTTATSGRGCANSSGLSGPAGASLRTCLGTSRWGSTRCWLTWTTSATPAGRPLYRLRLRAHPTGGTGSGSSPAAGILWPTPRAGKTTDEHEATWRARQERGDVTTPPLGLAVRMWPTPPTADGQAGRCREGRLSAAWVTRLMGYPDGWLDPAS